jgi:cleavage and polyadenylation specificity factor subunit 1
MNSHAYAIQIWTLPKLSLAFAANNIEGLQPSVIDSVPKPGVCVLDDDTQVPSDGVVDEALIACVGEETVHPYLFVRPFPS